MNMKVFKRGGDMNLTENFWQYMIFPKDGGEGVPVANSISMQRSG